ncbi:hypothetical protein [Priestia aryabhattai]|uniref:hypothetical protein n=1 Tax=Priestia aryabhattai TaxID=412384 RepID=UPI00210A5DAC|nr:hypothetical protein [Priestia aryabhattai]
MRVQMYVNGEFIGEAENAELSGLSPSMTVFDEYVLLEDDERIQSKTLGRFFKSVSIQGVVYHGISESLNKLEKVKK